MTDLSEEIESQFTQVEKFEKELFKKAYDLAKTVHKNQTRDDGAPYITHIDGVLDIFQNELKADGLFLLNIVTVLHDVIEDSSYTRDDLKSMFTEMIADWVDELSKKNNQATEDYLNGISFLGTANIKLADRIHNVRSLKLILNSKPEKVKKYIKETENYYLPFAEKNNLLAYDILKKELINIKKAYNERLL